MILSLTLISLVMAAALGFVYTITKTPIENANDKKVLDAIAKVVPAYNNDPVKEAYTVAEGKDTVYFFPAKMDGALVGTAVKTFTQRGFSGYVRIMVGLLPDGSIYKTEVLEQKETPGLGTLILEDGFKMQFEGKNTSDFKLLVKKDGGDVDAITAATISSRAYCNALQRAIDLYKQANGNADSAATGNIADTILLTTLEPLILVMPAFDNDPLKEVQRIDGMEMFVGRKGSKVTGYAVKCSAKGYSDTDLIWVLTGFKPDCSINAVTILRQKETQGRGSLICDEEFLGQFRGKTLDGSKLLVVDDGGEIDGVSGSTISSRAACKAIMNACNIVKKGGVK